MSVLSDITVGYALSDRVSQISCRVTQQKTAHLHLSNHQLHQFGICNPIREWCRRHFHLRVCFHPD